MFVFGLFDLVLNIGLCAALSNCGQTVLLWCAVVSLLNTTLLTWFLGYSALRAILSPRIEGEASRLWVNRHPTMGPLIVMASSSNLSSMAILRLRICGKMLVDFPNSADHRFWFFLRNAGLYHYVVEDIPHLVISIALLNAPALEGFAACTESGGESTIIDVPRLN
jgi:hypothetical protein